MWSHNSAPDLTLAAVTQRTSRIRMGIGVGLAPIPPPAAHGGPGWPRWTFSAGDALTWGWVGPDIPTS